MKQEVNQWKIFVASTAYDLEYVRNDVAKYLVSKNIKPVMYDFGKDFIIDPDVHSHVSCVKSVELADIFLLILDKRYGGQYIKSPKDNISITRAEFLTAKKLKLPTIILVNEKLESERFFITNNIKKQHGKLSTKELSELILKEKVNYADKPELIDFLQYIHKQPTGNYISTYSTTDDLINQLTFRLNGLTHTILKRLAQTQKVAISEKFTVFGKQFNFDELFQYIYINQDIVNGKKKIHFNDFYRDSVLSSINGYSLILGEPGVGKSVFLAKCFLYSYNKLKNSNSIQIPIYFDLRTIRTDDIFSIETLLDYIFTSYLNRPIFSFLKFEHLKIIYFLDGLDEIPDHLHKKLLIEGKFNNLKQFTGFITCRENFYQLYVKRTLFENDVRNIFTLVKWSFKEGVIFIKNWLNYKNKIYLQQDFINSINTLKIDEIICSPILCSMYAFTIDVLDKIPQNIVDRSSLYQYFFETISDWELSKQSTILKNDKNLIELRNCWKYISWKLYSKKSSFETIYKTELESFLSEKKVEDLIIKVAIDGLVVMNPINEEVKSMLHETLQEFLLAQYGVLTMQNNSDEVKDFLICTLKGNISSFVKEIWRKSIGKSFLNNTYFCLTTFIKENFDNLSSGHQKMVTNAIYYLSRIPLEKEVIQSLRDLLKYKLPIVIRDAVLFALTKLGDTESEENLKEILMTEVVSNSINRAIHIEYFYEFQMTDIYPPFDTSSSNIVSTVEYLLANMQRGNKRDILTCRIDTITILSLYYSRNIETNEIIKKLSILFDNLKNKLGDNIMIDKSVEILKLKREDWVVFK